MSFGAKVTKVKKTTARSKTVEENAQLREAAKGVKFLTFWINEKKYDCIGVDNPRWQRSCSIPEKLSGPKSGKIFNGEPSEENTFLVLSAGAEADMPAKEGVVDSFINSNPDPAFEDICSLNATREVEAREKAKPTRQFQAYESDDSAFFT